MEGKTKVYRTYEWFAEECIRTMDEDVDAKILKDVLDCIYFAKGYCKMAGCVPVEVINHIADLEMAGRIAREWRAV